MNHDAIFKDNRCYVAPSYSRKTLNINQMIDSSLVDLREVKTPPTKTPALPLIDLPRNQSDINRWITENQIKRDYNSIVNKVFRGADIYQEILVQKIKGEGVKAAIEAHRKRIDKYQIKTWEAKNDDTYQELIKEDARLCDEFNSIIENIRSLYSLYLSIC